MTRAAALLGAVLIVCGAPGAHANEDRAPLTIAYTAEIRGNILPCPCPRDPLGGIDRRVGFVDSLRAEVRGPLLVLDAGAMIPTRRETSMLSEEQAGALRCLMADGIRAMAYDAVAGIPEGAAGCESGIPWLAPNDARLIVRNGVRVVVASVNESIDPAAARAAIRREGRHDVLVLLVDGDLHYASRAAQALGARVAVVSRGACFPEPVRQDGIVYLGPGRDGKYVGLVTLNVAAGEPRVLSASLRRMDGSTPRASTWAERVDALVLEVERANPGALFPRE